MCGILGVFGEKPDANIARKMLNSLEHRGPDEGYLWYSKNAFLGVRRLSIVNVHNGKQPCFNEDKSIVAILNGEIFNHKEIKDILQLRGHKIPDGSDAEIITHAYEEWGLDFCNKLNGDFAIALYFPKVQKLMLFRDRVGVKPLFYTLKTKGIIAFASEAKALFRHPRIDAEINHNTLADIFTFWAPVQGQTSFKDIFEVPAGMALLIDLKNMLVKSKVYWDLFLASENNENAKNCIPFEEAKIELKSKLIAAVKTRLQAEVPVATYTSGGVDSSIINQIAYRDIGHENAQTFSVSFEDDLYDERKFQRGLSRILKIGHNEVRCKNSDIVKNIENVLYHTESPLFRTAPIPMYKLSEKVRSKNVKVVLTGEGADEFALGYDIFREAQVRKFWARQPQSKSRPQLFSRMYNYLPQFQNKRYINLTLEFFKNKLTDVDDPLYSHALRILNSTSTHHLFSREFLENITNNPAEERLINSLPDYFYDLNTVEKAQYVETKTLLSGYLLSVQGDRMLSAHGVEGRYPYLDYEVIEFLNSLPQGYKLRGLKDKFILREAFVGSLPETFLKRPKHAYRAPEAAPFLKEGHDIIQKYLSESMIKKHGIYNASKVQEFLKRLSGFGENQLSTRDNLMFIQLLSAQIFAETFYGSQSPEAEGSLPILEIQDV